LYLLHTASENTNIRLKHVFSGIEANKTWDIKKTAKRMFHRTKLFAV
jgi:hypothetical protein